MTFFRTKALAALGYAALALCTPSLASAQIAADDLKDYDSGVWQVQFDKSFGGELVFSDRFGGGSIWWKLPDSRKQYSCRAAFNLPSQDEYPQSGLLELDAVFGPDYQEACPADMVQMSVGPIDPGGTRTLNLTVGAHEFEGTLLKLVSYTTPLGLHPRLPDNLTILGATVGMGESDVITMLSNTGYSVIEETDFLPSRHVFTSQGGYLNGISAQYAIDPILQEQAPFYSVTNLTRDPEGYNAYKANSKTPINHLPDTIQLITIGETVASISRVIPFDQSIFEKFQSDLALKYGTGADGGVPILKGAKIKRVALFGRNGKEVDPKKLVGGAGYPWVTDACLPTIDAFEFRHIDYMLSRHLRLSSDPIRSCSVEVQYSMLPSDGSVPAMAHVQISSRAIAQDAAMKAGLASALDKVLSATFDAMLEANSAAEIEAAAPDL
ncbi:hypothetical protein FIU89_11360 [Roseovarius sp. THAF27]|uniref:hypothetical protein n=1 Tax=unclassified Roseovarius TaxID=2614913 RepID=UPI001267F429|nr:MULTISPECIES: hypothetical protein [unclassified Roseovarius]QFT81207.1 hypothetical protein FIU89_11360 [Roseovarius sp. THAF27]QFT95698.1 hypothetical protein FIU85_00130 [Roseovarius sp. THAF8]